MGSIENSISLVKESLHLFDDPVLYNCKSGAEYLLSKLDPIGTNLNELMVSFKLFVNDANEDQSFMQLLTNLAKYAHLTSECVVFGKITSLTAADIKQGEG